MTVKIRYRPLAAILGTLAFCGIAWQVNSMGTAPPSDISLVKEGVKQRLESLPKPSETGPHPKAVCESHTHEFGTMALNSTGRHVFTIRNEGQAPLVIKQGLKSCKCTVAEVQAVTIPEGKSCEIPITWDLREIDETFYQIIHFHTNDPETETVSLSIKGRVAPNVIVDPKHTWDLGEIERDNGARLRGGVVSPLTDQLQVLEIKCGDPNLKFEQVPMTHTELEEVWAKSGSWIDVDASEMKTSGVFRVPFYIVTNQEDSKVIACVATGRRDGPVRVIPRGDATWKQDARVLDLGNFLAAQGKSIKLSLFLAQEHRTKLTLLDAKTTIPGLKVQLKPAQSDDNAAATYYELEVAIAPGSPPLARTKADPGFILLTTDNPELSEWRMEIHAISN